MFAQGISHLDAHGVVNMDLTISNVLIKDGRAKLSDFGIAAIVPVDRASDHAFCLTYDSHFNTLIHPFALAPDVLTAYHAAVDAYAKDPSQPQYIPLKHQGVHVLATCKCVR